jgi:Fe-S cluster assembly protein SufB
MDDGLREHEDLVREYFGTVVPYRGQPLRGGEHGGLVGRLVRLHPAGVKLDMPLQAYFRINAESMGQFERTLIIVEEGAQVQYIEGCTAPTYSARLVPLRRDRDHRQGRRALPLHDDPELVHNVYNLVTQRAMVGRDGTTSGSTATSAPSSR